ncbi:hypothetical protein KCP77_15400 [Salmonella enterica subsp. enterica]|nr:hypothetical protein KCP77_15400 [Salmonella enterica subsp. enterica]
MTAADRRNPGVARYGGDFFTASEPGKRKIANASREIATPTIWRYYRYVVGEVVQSADWSRR